MTFKQAIIRHQGLATIANELELCSTLGSEKLFSSIFSKDDAWIKQQFEIISDCQSYICEEINRKNLRKIRAILASMHDIKATLKLLQNGAILDDISLFEIKTFAIACKKIKSLMFDFPNLELMLPDLNEIITILDPEGLETPQFYIYSAYSKQLAQARKDIAALKKEHDDDALFEQAYCKCMEIESKIRERLSKELQQYVDITSLSIDIIASIDLNFAKAELFSKWGMKEPTIVSDRRLEFHALSYPLIAKKLEEKGKRFQPIDISLNDLPVLVTGANMAGKTILLKSISLAQYLLQFGFFVAADQASMCLVDEILTSIGDNQNEQEGLSSFASEILTINKIIQTAKSNQRCLILIDELARTTNPYEGAALVRGFIKVIAPLNSLSITTTHYSIAQTNCRRLRVKGFINKNVTTPIAIEDISDNIDYSLVEDANNSTPQEAISLAKLLAVDEQWIKESEQ